MCYQFVWHCLMHSSVANILKRDLFQLEPFIKDLRLDHQFLEVDELQGLRIYSKRPSMVFSSCLFITIRISETRQYQGHCGILPSVSGRNKRGDSLIDE